MDIKRSGSQPSGKGPADWFTGTVRIDPLLQPKEPARTAGASVTFEPGARTAWHTHPLGQTLIVTAGGGRAQRLGTSAARRHDQRLPERMRVPRRARSGLERDARPCRARRLLRLKQRIDPHRASKPVSRTFARRLRTT